MVSKHSYLVVSNIKKKETFHIHFLISVLHYQSDKLNRNRLVHVSATTNSVTLVFCKIKLWNGISELIQGQYSWGGQVSAAICWYDSITVTNLTFHSKLDALSVIFYVFPASVFAFVSVSHPSLSVTSPRLSLLAVGVCVCNFTLTSPSLQWTQRAE